MRKATYKDKGKAIHIISDSFEGNPAVNWTVKQDGKREKRYKRLAAFVFKKSLRRDAIYLSSDEECVIVFYKSEAMKETFRDFIDKMIMALGVIGFSRIGEITKREKYIESKRFNKQEFLYCWFFGATKEGKGQHGPVELKDWIIAESERMKLPIVMETTIPIIMRVYHRYGFKIYHEWEVKDKGLTFWLMIREPKILL